MKVISSIREIKTIIDELSEREKKAADRYFTRFYKTSKEYRLFKGLRHLKSYEPESMNELALALGYDSIYCRPFQKLKSRLKQKLADFLISDFTSYSLRTRNARDNVKIRLKKLNLQACILSSKGFHQKARNLNLAALKLAEQHQHYDEAVNSLRGYLGEVYDVNGAENYQVMEKKIQRYGFLHQVNEAHWADFKKLMFNLDLRLLDDPSGKLGQFLEDMASPSVLNESVACKSLHEFAIGLHHFSKGNFELSIQQYELWKARERKQMTMHDQRMQLEFERLNMEALVLLREQDKFQNFVSREIKKYGLKQADFYFLRSYMHGLTLLSLKTPISLLKALRKNELDKPQTLLFRYYQCHHYFEKGQRRECLDLINQTIRKFETASVQQLDLMVLEMLCLLELRMTELFPYKVQGMIKNLGYRKKFQVPDHYYLIYRIFRRIVRHNGHLNGRMIADLRNKLELVSPSPLIASRSLQPVILEKWLNHHFRNEFRYVSFSNKSKR